MKITRRHLRQVIKEELSLLEADRDGDGKLSADELRRMAGDLDDGEDGMAPYDVQYSDQPTSIEEKAKQIGDGFIIDLNSMESSGGGLYSSYRVSGGKATLDVRHIGSLAYALSEEAKDRNPIMLGGTAIHIFPNELDWAAMNDDF